MSLELLEKNFIQVKELIERYNRLVREKNDIENKIKSLKLEYAKGKYGRDVFSDYNKRLNEINDEIEKLKMNLKVISGSIKKEADEEINNVKQY